MYVKHVQLNLRLGNLSNHSFRFYQTQVFRDMVSFRSEIFSTNFTKPYLIDQNIRLHTRVKYGKILDKN